MKGEKGLRKNNSAGFRERRDGTAIDLLYYDITRNRKCVITILE